MNIRWWIHPPDRGLRFQRDPQPDWQTARVIGEVTIWTPGEGEVTWLHVQCPAGCGEHRVLAGQYACGNVRWKVSEDA
jgi:hypothetical protein